MKNNSENLLPNRKPTRLKDYDYSVSGYYFITICTQNKKYIFEIESVGNGLRAVPCLQNKIIHKWVRETENKFSNIKIEKYVIMPNHIHLILRVDNTNGTSRAPSPTNNIISHTVSTLKRFVNKEIGQNVFQRSFYDHIIRGELDYMKIWEYIDNNPAKWQEDELYE